MKIAIISPDYPYNQSNNYVFVKQLVEEWKKSGHEIFVFAPQSITKVFLKRNVRRPRLIEIDSGYHICSPWYISFSNIPMLSAIAQLLVKITLNRAFYKHCRNCELIYAHFLSSGKIAYYLGMRYKIPYFIASGESSFNHYKNIKLFQSIINHANGIIAVSSEINDRIVGKFSVSISDKILIAPNGFNKEKFYHTGKEIRQVLGYSDKDFIISFVGSFIERKGILILDRALTEINNKNIKVIFIGNGNLIPTYNNILHVGPVKHNEIVKYLNSSDIFVLPTLNEGSCNAIIEAIACGLPIVSSKNPFNDDILSDNYSIRVDPQNVDEVKMAILKLFNDPQLRNLMSHEALKAAENFPLSIRAEKILSFMLMKI